MRYYRIEISDADGAAFATYTSFVNGATDPGALQVELDIVAATYATPVGNSFVRIWGVPITVISQSRDFNGKRIKVYGGMQKGLPLANPAQAGLLVQGDIIQAFGNWIGTDMSLDLIMVPSAGSPSDPRNIVLNWQKGKALSEAIKTTLQTAFPGRTVTVNISSDLVQDRDEAGYWASLSQFAPWLKQKTIGLKGGDYTGADIFITETEVRVYDETSQSAPLEVAFNDLIGQPTWIEPAVIQVSCVMRADISVGDYIKLPKAQVTTTPQSLSQYRDASVFQGTFQVRQVRHVGAFRTPDATAWLTVIDAYPAVAA